MKFLKAKSKEIILNSFKNEKIILFSKDKKAVKKEFVENPNKYYFFLDDANLLGFKIIILSGYYANKKYIFRTKTEAKNFLRLQIRNIEQDLRVLYELFVLDLKVEILQGRNNHYVDFNTDIQDFFQNPENNTLEFKLREFYTHSNTGNIKVMREIYKLYKSIIEKMQNRKVDLKKLLKKPNTSFSFPIISF
tara:strand:- start:7497 stop:8072 length:576 start_codon:yes stop_codon:yes gene_type:complete